MLHGILQRYSNTTMACTLKTFRALQKRIVEIASLALQKLRPNSLAGRIAHIVLISLNILQKNTFGKCFMCIIFLYVIKLNTIPTASNYY